MTYESLGRRERQLMDVLYRLGQASVSDVRAELDDPPSYSAVRTQLGILVEKGHLVRRFDGPRYVYVPTVPREAAGASALDGLLRNFFGGSRERLFAALLGDTEADMSREELDRLAHLIEEARKEGR